ncbi:hypothetical protein ACN28S_23845 [Cystobacter fuscus]
MATCLVSNAATQVFTSLLYTATNPTTKTAACTVTLDSQGTASGGAYVFESNEARTSSEVRYRDVPNGTTTILGTATCTKY